MFVIPCILWSGRNYGKQSVMFAHCYGQGEDYSQEVLLTPCVSSQALQKTLAIRLLLDPSFWQRHQRVRGPFNMPVQLANSEQDNEESGLSWKLVWILLRKVLDFQWLQLVPLLHRKDACDLQLVVLGVLQFLSPDIDSRPQTVVNRLKVCQ